MSTPTAVYHRSGLVLPYVGTQLNNNQPKYIRIPTTVSWSGSSVNLQAGLVSFAVLRNASGTEVGTFAVSIDGFSCFYLGDGNSSCTGSTELYTSLPIGANYLIDLTFLARNINGSLSWMSVAFNETQTVWQYPAAAASDSAIAINNQTAIIQQGQAAQAQRDAQQLEAQQQANDKQQAQNDFLMDDTAPATPDLSSGGLGDPSASLTDSILGLPQKLLVVQECGFTTGNESPVLALDPMAVLPQDCDFIGHIPLMGSQLKSIIAPLATLALVVPFGIFAFLKIRETIEKW